MKTACLLLAEGFEEVEALTQADYLRRAGIHVTMVGIAGRKVKGSHDITVEADAGPEALDGNYDAIILPGGMPGASNLAESPTVRNLIVRHYTMENLLQLSAPRPPSCSMVAAISSKERNLPATPVRKNRYRARILFPTAW